MTLLQVELDEGQVRGARAMLAEVSRGYPRALGRGTRRATTAVRSRVVAAVGRELAVRRSKLHERGNPRRPVREELTRSGGDVVGGRVVVDKGRIALGRFSPRQHWRKGKGGGRVRSRVSYRIKRGGGRRSLGDAFVVEFASGYRAVFRGYRSRGRRRELTAQDELYGPSVPEVAGRSGGVRRLLAGEASELYERAVADQVDYLHRRAGGRS